MGKKVFIFPMREGKTNTIVQRPSLSSLPEGEGSFTFLSAQKSEAKRRAKRYSHFPCGKRECYFKSPHPRYAACGTAKLASPRPFKGRGRYKMYLSAVLSAGVGWLKIV